MFSRRTSIPLSATVAMNDLAQQKRQAGIRVYNLTAGEPMVETARYLNKMVQSVLKSNQTHYPAVPGLWELRNAASAWMNENYNARYTWNNTIITCGGKFGLYLLFQALLEVGDEALVIAPYWVSYPAMIQLAGGKAVIIQTEEEKEWKVSPEQIANACSKKTKILVLNNAANPTGIIYNKTELEAILEVAAKKNLLIISDEVYSGLTYEQPFISCASFRKFQDRIIIVQSCSKNFAMTGWRIGFVFGPPSIIKILIKLQGQTITNTSIISQWAGVAALQKAEKITGSIRREMKKRRDLFVKTFNKLFGARLKLPAAAFYCFIPLKAFGVKEKKSVKFCEKILKEANVAMVPGAAFGKEGYVRCSYGDKPKELKAGLRKLAEYLK